MMSSRYNYEAQTQHPPTNMLPMLAKALGVSADELLGMKSSKTKQKPRDNRLWRRFSLVEKMGQKEKRQILQILDAFIEREQLKKRAEAR